MHSELAHAFKGVAGDDAVRCVVITGAGRGFCAGQYLSDEALNIDSGPAALGDSLECNYNPLIRKISAQDKPVICALNGIAAGAGASLAMTCDFIVAADMASFNRDELGGT